VSIRADPRALVYGVRIAVRGLTTLATSPALSARSIARQLRLGVEIGYFARMIFRRFESEALASEDYYFGVTKGLGEEIGVASLLQLALSKPFVDTASALDAVRLATGKGLAHSVLSTDLVARATTKPFTEAVSAPDVTVRSTGKVLADPVLTTELVRRALTKVLADGIAVTDVLATGRSFVRNREELVAVTDALSLEVDAPGVADDAGTTDEILVAYLKRLASSGEFTDHAVKAAAKRLGHAVGATDTTTRAATKPLANVVQAGDSGWLLNQSYADYTYFAEDYVGQTRTF
jgi:hypothetical protein